MLSILAHAGRCLVRLKISKPVLIADNGNKDMIHFGKRINQVV